MGMSKLNGFLADSLLTSVIFQEEMGLEADE